MDDHELINDKKNVDKTDVDKTKGNKIDENGDIIEKTEKETNPTSKSTLFKAQSEQELIKKIAYHEAYSTAYKLKLAQKVAVKVGKAAVKGAIKGSVAISKKINDIRKEQKDNKLKSK